MAVYFSLIYITIFSYFLITYNITGRISLQQSTKSGNLTTDKHTLYYLFPPRVSTNLFPPRSKNDILRKKIKKNMLFFLAMYSYYIPYKRSYYRTVPTHYLTLAAGKSRPPS